MTARQGVQASRANARETLHGSVLNGAKVDRAVLPAPAISLRSAGRYGPHGLVPVDLRPRRPPDLAGAGRRQHQELEGQLHDQPPVRLPNRLDRARGLAIKTWRSKLLCHNRAFGWGSASPAATASRPSRRPPRTWASTPSARLSARDRHPRGPASGSRTPAHGAPSARQGGIHRVRNRCGGPDHEALDPTPAPGGPDIEVKAVPIAVPSRPAHVAHEGGRERVAGMPTAPLAFRRSPFGPAGGQDEIAVDSASPIPIGRHPGAGRLRPVLFGRPVPL